MAEQQSEPTARERSRKRFDIHPTVFWASAGLIAMFVLAGVIFLDRLGPLFGTLQAVISEKAGWFLVLSVNLYLLFAVYLLFSRYGDIRLGGTHCKADFNISSWLAMLFSAGMGIGLVFWSVAEPMTHFAHPPFGESHTAESARLAMRLTFFHWGLHAWAVYVLVGLSLAFFSFNQGLPLTIRSGFYPLLGEHIHSWPGDLVDILAVVATLFGVATSLGLGVQQINSGLNHLFQIGESTSVQVVLIAAITCLATTSVVLGLDKGIRRFSEVNMLLALSLLVFVLVAGPTVHLLNAAVQNIGDYVQMLPELSTWTETYSGGNWQNGWTVFYWAWWIAWSPFVGMFIARISRGRTIREFVGGVLFVPTGLTFVWLTVFGNAALFAEQTGAGGIAETATENLPLALFALLEQYPLASATSVLAILVVVTFFVTSSDSGSLVIDIITAGGNPDPPVLQRVFWAVLEGVVAAVLLVGGGLTALQTAAITTGLPFAVVLILMMISLLRGLDLARPVAR